MTEPATQPRKCPPALVVTTSWDDGHPSDLRVAELLAKYRVAGTFYIPTRNSENRPVLNRAEIAEVGTHFELGGHTRDHVSLTAVPSHVAREQIVANKAYLEDIWGRSVDGFAYVRGHHDEHVRRHVQEAGFSYARTTRNLICTPGSDRYQVPTTAQFYPHSATTVLKNFVSGGPMPRRAVLLPVALGSGELSRRLLKMAAICPGNGGYFHLWGHSWELDELNLWPELSRLLHGLSQLPATFVTNAEWSEGMRQSKIRIAAE